MARKQVQVGQVYQLSASTSGRTWKVQETLILLGIPHARVVSIEGEGDVKTLSCLVLSDPNFYRLVDGGALHHTSAA